MKKCINCLLVVALLTSTYSGCVPKQDRQLVDTFEHEELDSCMTFLIDLSGSFASNWNDRAYSLFMGLSEQYFAESMGTNNKLIIAQLSGNDRVVLFDGRPVDLQRQFSSPEALSEYLKEKSDGSQSHVYNAVKETVDYAGTLRGVTDTTRMLTVVLSDMRDSEIDPDKRSETGNAMVASLSTYREAGGTLALYYVGTEQTARWQRILAMAGFEQGSYVIENELSSNPQLPRLD